MLQIACAFVALLCAGVSAQPFQVGTGFGPTGNLRSVDSGGPYNLSLLSVQQYETRAGLLARANYTDKDRIAFLTNVECLEGRFDTFGTLGLDFNDNLTLGSLPTYGFGKANLSADVYQVMSEVAASEQGHALFTRHAGSTVPCPVVNYTAGFNDVLAVAYGLTPPQDISVLFGAPWDPYHSDETYLLSVVFLEELGATGNKGLISQYVNPVLADGQAGLAASATAFAAAERYLLFQRANNTVYPTNETVAQVFARLSAFRDAYDGPQIDDQGLLNTDPRTIALGEANYINLFPTDIRGLTFSRTPQQLINIYTIGSPQGIGGFFPQGLQGVIKTPTGFDQVAGGLDTYPVTANAYTTGQETVAQVGTIAPPVTDAGPYTVPDMLTIIQSQGGLLETSSYTTRGYLPATPVPYTIAATPKVMVGTPSGQAVDDGSP